MQNRLTEHILIQKSKNIPKLLDQVHTNHKKAEKFHQNFATVKQPKTENSCDRRQLEAELKNSY